MKKLNLIISLTLFSLFVFTGIGFAKDKVVIYTSLENDEIVKYLAVAKKDLPSLDIQAIRLSTGELGARMLAEKNNPQVDVIWGWAVTNLAGFVETGMIEAYKPEGWDSGLIPLMP